MITHHVSTSGEGITDLSSEEIDDIIYSAEGEFAVSPFVIPLIEPKHMFVPGLYFREFHMEENTYLTGKLHAQDDGLVVASGKVTFITKDSKKTIEGPCMLIVKANTKPLLYAHTHVVFFSAHANPDDTQDLDVIESRVVIKNILGCKPNLELK